MNTVANASTNIILTSTLTFTSIRVSLHVDIMIMVKP